MQEGVGEGRRQEGRRGVYERGRGIEREQREVEDGEKEDRNREGRREGRKKQKKGLKEGIKE